MKAKQHLAILAAVSLCCGICAVQNFAADTSSEKDYITEAYARDYSFTTERYDETTGDFKTVDITYTYRIPAVNLPGADIEIVNRRIYTYYVTLTDWAIDEMKMTGEPGYTMYSEGISYDYAVNDDILSLVIFSECAMDSGGGNEYGIYNISLADKKEVDDEAVLEEAGLSEAEYRTAVKKQMETVFRTMWDEVWYGETPEAKAQYENALQTTISDEYVQMAEPYLNDKGELCVIATVYSLADHGFVVDVNLNTGEYTGPW